MLTAQQYLELIYDRGKRGLVINRIYRNIQREDLLLAAYSKLYSNTGAMTSGTDPSDTVDGMSLAKIRQILKELEDGEYRWKPARRIYIPKRNGKLRPLGIPSWKDKMLQETVRSILEAYYEPQSSEHSHGFRPERGCHTALKEIVLGWKGTKWFIEGDIKGCFDNIDHDTLLGILGKKIEDNRLMKLLRHMLNAGYMEDWRYNQTYSGTPQGGVISPLLANIYLNELDQFITKELLPRYNRGKERKVNAVYNRLHGNEMYAKRTGKLQKAREYAKAKRKISKVDSMDADFRRLRYVRYADDFLLGFSGPKSEALEIKQEIGRFLRDNLKLEMAEDKTLITHAATKPAKFLGYNVHVAQNNSYQKDGRRSGNGVIQLRVPQETQREWISKYTQNGKTVHRAHLLREPDFDIVEIYGAELRGLANYYGMAVNAGRLYRIKHVMMESLVKTLASKHKTSSTSIYRKYATVFETGMKGILVEIQREGKKPLQAKFGEKPIRYQRIARDDIFDRRWEPKLGRTQIITRLLADECELCGSKDTIQVHHIRKLADIKKMYANKVQPPWVFKMLARQRKTLVVCKDCHWQIHGKKYDGPAISSWRAE